MRQLTPATNLVLACLAAFGLVGILGAPWYAPYVPDTNVYDGPVERAAFAVSHVFSHHERVVTGTDALGSGTKTILMVLIAAVVVLSALAAVPALRAYVRDVLRAVALALPLLVFYLLVDRPGKGLDIHWGVIAAFAVAAFVASAAWHGSSIRVKRVAPGTWERRPA